MSDRYYARIEIGGDIPESLLPDLSEAIAGEFGEGLGSGQDVSIDEIKRDIVRRMKGSKTLSFEEPEARWGEFEDLEAWLSSNEIAFNRYSERYCEYEPCTAWYRPDMSSPEEMTTDDDGRPAIDAYDLMEALNESVEYLDKVKAIKDVPLLINSSKSRVKEWAQEALKKNKIIEPADLIRRIHKEFYQAPIPEVPDLRIIKDK